MSECVRSSLGWGWSNLWSLSARDRWSSITRKNSGFKKTKRPTSVVESYKTTYGHKAVVLMSVVEARAENIYSIRVIPVLTPRRHSAHRLIYSRHNPGPCKKLLPT